MGKKARIQVKKITDIVNDEEILKKINDIKTEGATLSKKKEYNKAIEQYDQALKLLPNGSSEKADILASKGACYVGLKRWKDAVKECSNALDLQPSLPKALQLRAKAYQEQGLYKTALSDVQVLNKSEGATDESKEFEKKLKELVAGKRPNSVNGGIVPGAKASRSSRSPAYHFTAKCVLGNDVQVVHVNPASTYSEFYESVKAKYPTAGPFVLKYVDKDGDLVTVTCRNDLQSALAELLATYQKQIGNHGPKMGQSSLPHLKVQVVPVADVNDVPRPPLEEEQERQQILRSLQQAAKQSMEQQQQQQTEVIEIDEWLVDFAQLFKEKANVEPGKLVDFQTLGCFECTRAIEATLADERALPLFGKAADKFKEVICIGLLNWGNVHLYMAHKYLEDGAANVMDLAEARKKAGEELDAAEKKYKEAQEYKLDNHDALVSLAQLEMERAKIRAGLAVNLRDIDMDAEQAVKEAAIDKVFKASVANLKVEDVRTAQELYLPKMTVLMEEAHEKAPEKPPEKEDTPPKSPLEDPTNFKAQVLIAHGNYLFEWSQFVASTGGDWRAMLDDAVVKFKKAGCSESDIRNALKNHPNAEELDLGPDPEPEKAEEAPPAKAEEEVKPPEAKGLPSLAVKNKKKSQS